MLWSREEQEELLHQMTLEEKATLVNGATFFGMAENERLKIPRLQLLDGGTGINFEQLFGDYVSRREQTDKSTNGMTGDSALVHVIDYFYTPEKLSEEELPLYHWIKEKLQKQVGSAYAPACYPPGILLGATFHKEVVEKVGEALGEEASRFGVDILLGTPNVNIHRDPLAGRLFEGYSEDPCVVAELAPELVKGVQKYGVAANVKHFAANNQETNRVGVNETISRRALEEIYFPGFKACVTEGHVQTVMSAYNRINKVACSENHWLLTEKLRQEWGFGGMVVSDWGAVYHPVEAIAAGNDVAMPGPISPDAIIDAVKAGDLTMDSLNRAVLAVLSIISYCKDQADQPCYDVSRDDAALVEKTTKACYDAAAEGIVLLKNERHTFPICEKLTAPILVAGSGVKGFLSCGSGSAGITTNRNTDLLTCLKASFGAERIIAAEDTKSAASLLQTRSFSHIIVVSTVPGMEGNDRNDLLLPKEDRKLLQMLKECRPEQTRISLVLNTCGPVETAAYDELLDAIFCVFLPGMEGAHALVDLMSGKCCPSGKLPLTFPKTYRDTPTFLNFPGDGYEVNYGEGIYVGYRYYDKKGIAPAYAFGYGCSYTTFSFSDCKLSATEMQENVTISITVTNTGTVRGAEVVQLYVSDHVSALPKPVKELKAFEKVWLLPGEEKTVTFCISKKDLASYDPDYEMWIAEEGYYDLFLATSSRKEDVVAKKTIYLSQESPYSYGLNSTVKVLMEQDACRQALLTFWQEKGLDVQVLKSNYQYTPNKRLIEVMPEEITLEDDVAKTFFHKLGQIRRE